MVILLIVILSTLASILAITPVLSPDAVFFISIFSKTTSFNVVLITFINPEFTLFKVIDIFDSLCPFPSNFPMLKSVLILLLFLKSISLISR